MTQLEAAKKGIATDAMRQVAADEGVPVARVLEAVAKGWRSSR